MSGSNRKPFKLVEIPVNNFKEIAIPHHLKLLKEHKEFVEKEYHDNTKMKNEIPSIKRAVAQLKGLLYELDTLRAQVEDCDLDKFDMRTLSLRKTILQIISEYTELKQTINISSSQKLQQNTTTASVPETEQLQLNVEVDELKLNQRKECLENVEKLHADIQDLHSVYGSLHQMVVEQHEHVNTVDENVQNSEHNVNAGLRHIITATKLKASVYPVTGAVLGTCIGGPLGLVAGLKIGGLAALSCGLLGYIGGKVIKKQKLDNTNTIETNNEIQDENKLKKND